LDHDVRVISGILADIFVSWTWLKKVKLVGEKQPVDV
jgi:hypothetical protein